MNGFAGLPVKTGDKLEILTAKRGGPVQTGWFQSRQKTRAKSKIRQWFKKRRDKNMVQGKNALKKNCIVGYAGCNLKGWRIRS
jgi:(p)ppGpp synthase/HD superfamily hydrolase